MAKLETLIEGIAFGEGPRWRGERLWFSDIADHRVKSVSEQGELRVEVELGARRPSGLGWLPDARHHESGRTLPVMIAGMSGPDGKIMAVHRTFLRPDGSGKADVTPQKKIWPSFKGAAASRRHAPSTAAVAMIMATTIALFMSCLPN